MQTVRTLVSCLTEFGGFRRILDLLQRREILVIGLANGLAVTFPHGYKGAGDMTEGGNLLLFEAEAQA